MPRTESAHGKGEQCINALSLSSSEPSGAGEGNAGTAAVSAVGAVCVGGLGFGERQKLDRRKRMKLVQQVYSRIYLV